MVDDAQPHIFPRPLEARSLVRADALLAGHRRVLELMAKQAPLFTILHELVAFLENQYDGLLCSILLVDQEAQTFKVGVNACESKNFSLEASGVSILPPYVGPCCMSSHLGQAVVTEIADDPRWHEDWKRWAAEQGLHSCRSQPIIASNGRVLGAFAMYHKVNSDPTSDQCYQLELATLVAAIALERKNIETQERAQIQQQRQLNDELAHALDLRDEFLSLASHELRNPIQTLALQNHTFTAQVEASETVSVALVRKMLDANAVQLCRLVRYVETMLDASRFPPGKMVLRPEPCDLARLIAETCEWLRPQLTRARCQLEVHLPESVLGTWDAFRIGQVITNLVDNAIKYAPGRPIVITLTDRTESACFSVRDSGKGIALADRMKIFNRYERAAHTDSRTSGLGLGLYIVKEIVNAHSGSIAIESVTGRGAEFRVTLPKKTLEMSQLRE